MYFFTRRPMLYQPIVVYTPQAKAAIIGFEALYNHANNYQVFSNSNRKLEKDCLFSAIAEAVAYGMGNTPDLKLFVNASMNAIWELREEISLYTLKHLQPQQLVVEITEQPYNGPIDLMYQIIRELRERGFQVAIDDYGTGQSYKLIGAEVDYIKVDMSLIRDCNESVVKQKILKHLVKMYGNQKVIAEGVETFDECLTCYETGITKMQGYYFGYPDQAPLSLTKAILLSDVQMNCHK